MGGITHSWNGTVLTVTSDSGTSSADLKGDDGARGAQGATGTVDTDILNNYAKKISFSLEKGHEATITFSGSIIALICARGAAKQVRGTFVYSGYGIGGSDRVQITQLDAGNDINYTIISAQEGIESNGFKLTNSNVSNRCNVVILMIYGAEPTITTAPIEAAAE